MRIDATRRDKIHHLRQVGVILSDQINRHDARAQDFLTVVDVMQKRVQRTHPLVHPS